MSQFEVGGHESIRSDGTRTSCPTFSAVVKRSCQCSSPTVDGVPSCSDPIDPFEGCKTS